METPLVACEIVPQGFHPSGTRHWRAVSKAYDQPLLSLSNKNKKTKVFLAFDLLIKVVFNKNMTLSLRNTIIKVSLALSIALSALYALSILYLKKMNIFSIDRLISMLIKQGGGSPESTEFSIFWTIILAAVLFAFSIISSSLLYHYFKKKISPEIFFFVIFIICLSLQTIRLFQFQLIVLGVSSYFGVIITRVFYFFRLFGIFCFFASSLFPIGVKFQKFGTILLSILLLSFTISALMPIDPTIINSNLLYRLSDSTSMLIMVLSIRFLTVVNFTRAAITSKSKSYFVVLIASILIMTGEELLLVIPFPFTAFFMILAGTILYSRSIYNFYLWA